MSRRLLLVILIAALVLRLAYALAQDALLPYEITGGDTRWYLANAYALATGAPGGSEINGIVTDISTLEQPPIYFLITGLPQVWFTPAGATIAVRILQVLMSTVTCYFAYRMAYWLARTAHPFLPQIPHKMVGSRVGAHGHAPLQSSTSQTDSQKDEDQVPLPESKGLRARADIAGLIAAVALAFSPVFIMEAAEIKTETVFICFVAAGMWLYTEAISREERRSTLLIFAGVMLGLATLTRAVFLLFPLGLVVYSGITGMGWRRAALLLAVYALVVSTWTVYNLARWNRFVVAGEGLFAFLYVGATGWDGPEAVDERLLDAQPTPEATEEAPPRQPDFAEAASEAITSDISGYIRHRVSELAGAYLQPNGTLFFPGESLRELALNWLREDRSVSGWIALTQGDSFWQKLAIYVLHYTALIFGLVGMWRTRRNWRIALPMIGFILYTTLIHLFLLALPRYIFPTMVFWWVLAAAGIVGLRKRVNEVRKVGKVEE